MSIVDPWYRARTRETPTTAARLVGAAATGVVCLTLASLVAGTPGASALVDRPATGTASGQQDRRPVDVLVQGAPGAGAAVEAAVSAVGGAVSARLDVLDGVQASVPGARLDELRGRDGVVAVTTDSTLVPLDGTWGDDTTGESVRASRAGGVYQLRNDLGSAWSVASQVGAHDVWELKDPADPRRTLTGHGVGIAMVDTGVAAVEGLLAPGKVVHGPDLSFDSQAAGTRNTDGLGHGTHMAGLAAGRDGAVRTGREADPRHFTGIAPDAHVVSVKVGAGDGGVDVSQVIAGIDWVVSNRARHDVRVINLSYGTDSTQPYLLDPLAHAVESAWHAGIVVVVAAGNDGESGALPLTMPAADPFVIAVGSSDHRGSSDPAAARVGAWTNDGTEARRPDVLAPGKSVVSLRVPGSVADLSHPEALVPRDRSKRFFRGSGTSQSAAVVSGAVALLLQADPSLTPDQVKGLLRSTADPLTGDDDPTQGAGLVDVAGAVTALRSGPVPAFTQTDVRSTGLGSLQASRGSSQVVDPVDGTPLTGEQDPFGVAWDASTWAPASTLGRSWSGGDWRGSTWAGRSWSGDTWASVDWSGRSWSGRSWSGRSWSTMVFLGRSWRGDDWSGRSWSGRSWSGRSWSGRSWSAQEWAGRSWSAAGWSGRSWS